MKRRSFLGGGFLYPLLSFFFRVKCYLKISKMIVSKKISLVLEKFPPCLSCVRQNQTMHLK